jgi:hypothetical protein
MGVDRRRYGLLLSTLGAVVLAISVFLPWYGLSFTTAGIAFAQQLGNQVASQYGNAALQGYMSSLHADLGALAGHQFVAVSAHQVLKRLNVVLLVVAGLGILLSLVPLARPEPLRAAGDGPAIALLGALACVCVIYRMVAPPAHAGPLIAFSLREGAWLALLGSMAMVVGALWPSGTGARASSPAVLEDAWSGLSGWTPEA